MFRISNDVQRAKTSSAMEGFKRQHQRVKNEKGKKAADNFWKMYHSLVRQYEQQIARYDKLRKEGLEPFHGKDLRELGSYLVDARIAAGMTQMELAKKLSVSQPMIFKYELKEYQGYSLGVIANVVQALGVKADLSVWMKSSKKNYVEEKQKNIILYFLNTINNAYLGLTKLMKLLYYVDFEFYQNEGSSITGDQYVAMPYGPVPRKAESLLEKMTNDEQIHMEKVTFVYPQNKYYPKVEHNMSTFSAKELSHIENVAKRFQHWTAKQMSDLTHDEYPWQTTRRGEIIDYNLVLCLKTDAGTS